MQSENHLSLASMTKEKLTLQVASETKEQLRELCDLTMRSMTAQVAYLIAKEYRNAFGTPLPEEEKTDRKSN